MRARTAESSAASTIALVMASGSGIPQLTGRVLQDGPPAGCC
jgi:hypothetical protein